MPRYHEDYTLYPRKMRDGRQVWYWRTYQDGRRTGGRSTGKTTKREARAYCNALLKEGRLVRLEDPLFRDFARNFWDWDRCPYIRWRNAGRGRPVGQRHAGVERGFLTTRIMPYFKDYRLSEITDVMIEDWITGQADEVAPATCANLIRNLKTMLNWAVKRKLLHTNPAAGISIRRTSAPRGILTMEEARALFTDRNAWRDDVSYALNRMAAETGCRQGELLRLQRDDLADDHVILRRTKGEDPNRTFVVPVPKATIELVRALPVDGPFVFSLDGGESAYPPWDVTTRFYEALRAIGITAENRAERNITFHSWRHFFNTYLRGRGVPDAKIMAVTRHKTAAMMERYTHWEPAHFADIIEAQGELWG